MGDMEWRNAKDYGGYNNYLDPEGVFPLLTIFSYSTEQSIGKGG